jgi:hypothetical protein
MYSNICYDFICIYHFKLKVMQTIAQRAKSYVKGCELQGEEASKAEFDYIAGAKEERILLTEWRDASKELPRERQLVLIKPPALVGVAYDVALYSEGEFFNNEYSYPKGCNIKWRQIHEFEPTKKYYGDDDGRAE